MTRGRAIAFLCAIAGVAVFMRIGGTYLVVEQHLESPDVIVSLGSHEWERLPETAELAARYRTARVVLTLPTSVSERNCHDCGNRVARLVRMGVAAERITIVPLKEASGTYGEALALRSLRNTTSINKLLIVTSPYHTRRALATFRTVLHDGSTQVGVKSASDSPADPRRWWRTPYDRWYVRYEWLANVYYALRYGVIPRS